jgi:hypothetical protein
MGRTARRSARGKGRVPGMGDAIAVDFACAMRISLVRTAVRSVLLRRHAVGMGVATVLEVAFVLRTFT